MARTDLGRDIAEEFEQLVASDKADASLERQIAEFRARRNASARARYRLFTQEQMGKLRSRLRENYCRRRKLAVNLAGRRCEVCAVELGPCHASRRFCTTNCRKRVYMQERRRAWRERNPKRLPDSCRVCGAVFQAQLVTKRFCSGRCQQRAYRARRRAA